VTSTTRAVETLLAVQELDTILSQLQHQRAHLPERVAAASARAASSAATAALAELTGRREAIATSQTALERSLRELDARYADLAAKLPRTMVVREAEALMSEQQVVATRRSGVEDEELALLEEDEALDGEEALLRAEIDRTEKELAVAGDALKAAEAVLDEQEAELRRRRDEAAAPVPEELLARYEGLRTRLGGVAVARLVGGRCDGCHLALAAAALERIRLAPPDELVECEECGRLLVR
jgi:predicted  nucleic acid-binding Zn-ribbon protein